MSRRRRKGRKMRVLDEADRVVSRSLTGMSWRHPLVAAKIKRQFLEKEAN